MNRMRIPASSAARRQRCKGEARRTLFLRSNWISLLFVLFSFFFFLFGAMFFAGCLYYAVSMSGIADADPDILLSVYIPTAAVFLFFLLSPLLPGLTAYGWDLCRGRTEETVFIPPTELFCFYTSLDSVIRAWKLVFLRLAFLSLLPLSLLAALMLSDTADSFLLPMLPAAGEGISALICFIATVLLFLPAVRICSLSDALLFLAVTRPELSVSGCLRESARVMRQRVSEKLALRLSFVPLLALSVLSMGVLFFVFVLPYMLLADIGFFSEVCSELRSR